MAFDFKKEYKELYAPKKGPSILEVPPMHFVAVRGSGDPNDVEGAYQKGNFCPIRHFLHDQDE